MLVFFCIPPSVPLYEVFDITVYDVPSPHTGLACSCERFQIVFLFFYFYVCVCGQRYIQKCCLCCDVTNYFFLTTKMTKLPNRGVKAEYQREGQKRLKYQTEGLKTTTEKDKRYQITKQRGKSYQRTKGKDKSYQINKQRGKNYQTINKRGTS